MSYSFDGVNDWMRKDIENVGSASYVAPPITFACWFYANSLPGSTSGIANVHYSGGDRRTNILLNPAGTLTVAVSNTNVQATTTSGCTGGEWNHAAAVIPSTSSRTIYLNGGSEGTSTNASGIHSILTRISLGVRVNAAAAVAGTYFNGKIAEFCYWDAALTKDEVVSLSQGIKPIKIRPNNLISYIPLSGYLTDFADNLNNNSFTITGSPVGFIKDHPRRYG